MKRIYSISILLLFEWHMLGNNPQHTNSSSVSFSGDFKLLWEFNLSEHIFKHTRRRSVWSRQPVGAKIDDNLYIFIGTYTHYLLCIDAKSGKEIWRFNTGGPINSSPCFFWIDDKPILVVSSSDRMIYGLEAKTGKKLWNYQIYPWTFTVFEAIVSSPIVVRLNDSPYIVLGTWFSDRKPFKSIQKGELICLDGRDGKEIWRKEISQSYLHTPAFTCIKGRPLIFVSGYDGNLYCLSLKDGEIIWRFTSSAPITSTPLITSIKEKTLVIFGSLFGLIYCIDAEKKDIVWKFKTGMQVPCGATAESFLFVPSYDRFLYCLDVFTGKEIWRYQTKKHISSSPVVVKWEDKISVILTSLDNNIYLLDGEKGELFWRYRLGKRLWVYETRGETLWPSPIAVSFNNSPLLIIPWYDGKLYAFTSGN